MTFSDDKVICNSKELVPKKPRPRSLFGTGPTMKSLPALKDKFLDAVSLDLQVTATT